MAEGRDGPAASPGERDLGRRGWALLAAVFVAFVVVPVAIYRWPPGVSFVFAYLVLALVPGVLLALLAVWAAARP